MAFSENPNFNTSGSQALIHAISSYKDHLYKDYILNLPEIKDHQYWMWKIKDQKMEIVSIILGKFTIFYTKNY